MPLGRCKMKVYETDQRGVDRVASRVDGNSQSHDIGRSGVGDAAYLVMSRLPSVLQHSVMLSNGIGYLANNSIKVDMHLARHAGHNDFGAPGVHESLVRVDTQLSGLRVSGGKLQIRSSLTGIVQVRHRCMI